MTLAKLFPTSDLQFSPLQNSNSDTANAQVDVIIKYHSVSEDVSQTRMHHINVRYYEIKCPLLASYVIN